MSMFRKAARAALAGTVLLFLAGCPPKSGLSGTYEAKSAEGTMTLEFKSGNKVHMTMQPAGGAAENSDGDYMINGNQVTVQIPGGMPMQLTRNGNTLDASMFGQILHFEKK